MLATWLVVLVGGFGVMFAFWSASDYSGDKGFHYYQAATWGDGLFLPILAGSVVGYLSLTARQPNNRPRSHRQLLGERLAWTLAAGAALLGASTQFDWLVSDDTVLNWTIPTLHHFNAAGFYHGLYLIAMFGLNAYLAVRLALARMALARSGTQDSAVSHALYALIWFGAVGYLLLSTSDNLGVVLGDYLTSLPVVGLAFLGIAVFSALTQLRGIRARVTRAVRLKALANDLRAAAVGVLFAFGVCNLIATDAPGELEDAVLFASAFAFLTLSLLSIRRMSAGLTATLSSVLLAAGFGLGVTIYSAPSAAWAFACAISGVVALRSIAPIQPTFVSSRARHPLALMAAIGLYGALTQRHSAEALDTFMAVRGWHEDIPFLLMDVMIIVFAADVLLHAFRQTAIVGDRSELERRGVIRLEKRVMWVSILAVFFGLMILLLSLLVAETSTSLGVTTAGWIYLGTAAILAALLAGRVPKVGTRRPWWSIPVLVALYCCLVGYISDLRRPVLIDGWEVFLIFSILGSAAFIANGVLGNMGSLVAVKPDRFARVAILTLFVGAVAVFTSGVLPTRTANGETLAPSLISPTVGLLGCFLGAIIPTLLVCRLVRGAPSYHVVIQDSEIDGAFQDSLMAAFMVSAAGLVVIHGLEARGWIALVTLAAVWATAATGVWFTLRNNMGHLMHPKHSRALFDQALALAGTSGPGAAAVRDQHRALKRHLERQSWIVCFTLVPWPVVLLGVWWRRKSRGWDSDASDPDDTGPTVTFGQYLYEGYLLETSLRTGKHAVVADRELGLVEVPHASPRWWLRSTLIRS
ncbi:MAG: hypothetical protein LBJ08_02660 [Bifidobacteriaceae bacterium]|jgi:hypothetical protein|nr:hypothetical protein [Bifidobacteriaceae bacterium]